MLKSILVAAALSLSAIVPAKAECTTLEALLADKPEGVRTITAKDPTVVNGFMSALKNKANLPEGLEVDTILFGVMEEQKIVIAFFLKDNCSKGAIGIPAGAFAELMREVMNQ